MRIYNQAQSCDVLTVKYNIPLLTQYMLHSS